MQPIILQYYLWEILHNTLENMQTNFTANQQNVSELLTQLELNRGITQIHACIHQKNVS